MIEQEPDLTFDAVETSVGQAWLVQGCSGDREGIDGAEVWLLCTIA